MSAPARLSAPNRRILAAIHARYPSTWAGLRDTAKLASIEAAQEAVLELELLGLLERPAIERGYSVPLLRFLSATPRGLSVLVSTHPQKAPERRSAHV